MPSMVLSLMFCALSSQPKKRRGDFRANDYMKKLLKTPKYKGKEEALWVEEGPDEVCIWM